MCVYIYDYIEKHLFHKNQTHSCSKSKLGTLNRSFYTHKIGLIIKNNLSHSAGCPIHRLQFILIWPLCQLFYIFFFVIINKKYYNKKCIQPVTTSTHLIWRSFLKRLNTPGLQSLSQ